MYTYRYIVCTFSDQLWKRFDRSIVHSSAPYSSLRQEGTSDSSLKKVQVATKLDFFVEKNMWLYGYCLVVCVTPTALPLVIDCKLKLARIYGK